MKNFVLGHWSDILSVIAILLSVLSFIQNRRLHNDSKRLTVLPNLDVRLLIDSRIIGRVVQQEDAIDKLNVFKSKYSDYYTNHDVFLQRNCKALFSVLISNVGMGVAKNIRFSEIAIFLKDDVTTRKSNTILFTCSAGETKANKIYADYAPTDVVKVAIIFAYEDILGKTHILKNCYEPIDDKKCEMELIQSTVRK